MSINRAMVRTEHESKRFRHLEVKKNQEKVSNKTEKEWPVK